MHPSLVNQFRKFNEKFEGVVPYMYLDIKGLVTIGVGNLIDPVEEALKLPFRFKERPDLSATKTDIEAEWRRIKEKPSLAKLGHKACEPLTELDLDDTAIDALILKRLNENEQILKAQPAFKDFDNWPADAQLALLSMAWAMGPRGPLKFTRFSAACSKADFETAAAQCRMKDSDNAGLVPRNIANRLLLLNAAKVAASNMEVATLYYPRDLTSA